MRHQLRHRFGKRIIKELDWLSKSKTRLLRLPILRQVQDCLSIRPHPVSSSVQEMGLPIGSGMIESAWKWLIQQRFKE